MCSVRWRTWVMQGCLWLLIGEEFSWSRELWDRHCWIRYFIFICRYRQLWKSIWSCWLTFSMRICRQSRLLCLMFGLIMDILLKILGLAKHLYTDSTHAKMTTVALSTQSQTNANLTARVYTNPKKSLKAHLKIEAAASSTSKCGSNLISPIQQSTSAR